MACAELVEGKVSEHSRNRVNKMLCSQQKKMFGSALLNIHFKLDVLCFTTLDSKDQLGIGVNHISSKDANTLTI